MLHKAGTRLPAPYRQLHPVLLGMRERNSTLTSECSLESACQVDSCFRRVASENAGVDNVATLWSPVGLGESCQYNIILSNDAPVYTSVRSEALSVLMMPCHRYAGRWQVCSRLRVSRGQGHKYENMQLYETEAYAYVCSEALRVVRLPPHKPAGALLRARLSCWPGALAPDQGLAKGHTLNTIHLYHSSASVC